MGNLPAAIGDPVTGDQVAFTDPLVEPNACRPLQEWIHGVYINDYLVPHVDVFATSYYVSMCFSPACMCNCRVSMLVMLQLLHGAVIIVHI